MWLAAFLLVLFAGYTAAWLYIGSMLKGQAEAALAEANRQGVKAQCEDLAIGGFPLEIGVNCDRVHFDDQQGTTVTAGALRSAAQVFNPFRIVGELDGPATIEVRNAPALQLSWQSLSASARLATPLPERASVEGSGLAAGPVSSEPLINAATFEGHLQPNGADLDVSGSVGGLTAAASVLQGRIMPPLSGALDATIADGIALLESGIESLRGQSAVIRKLSVSTGATAGIDIKGNISVDQGGLIDADLVLTIRDPEALAQIASTAFPEAAAQIDNAVLGLAALGDTTSLPLKITRGRASLGFIPLGDVPPL